MAIDDTKVIVPGEGHFYIADYGTTAPTGTGVPSSPFVEVGHTEYDTGLTLSREGGDSSVLPTWQAPAGVRTHIDPVSYTVEFQLLQWDATTMPLYFGGGTIVSGKFQVPKAPAPVTKALYVRIVDGTNIWTHYITKCEIIGSDDVEADPEKLMGMTVTATILADSAIAYLFAIGGTQIT